MDVENMLEVEDNLDSLIKIDGNFFIMDSEQLVSNPFQELQQDAVNEANSKKNSMTEKLTIVKNNVCENHFQMAKSNLERQRTSRLKQLHDHANRLRHEVKLLDLDRQRHTVEVRKRLEPEKDYSYDEVQIHNTEKRLGANIASFYLDKKLKYPMRLRSMKDIRVTPTISKARAKIRTSDVNKTLEEEKSFSRQERAQTAKTTVSSIGNTSFNSAVAFRRRGSRSAPLHNDRTTRSAGSSKTLFPAIGGENNNSKNSKSNLNNRRAGLSRSKTFIKEGSVSGSEKDHHIPQQVKFAFENPLKILASSEESANMFARSCSYYPGSTRAVNFGADSSDDEDALSEHEMIDLKAILFPDDNKTSGPTHSSLSEHQIWALRKAQGPAPKLSTTQKEEEANVMDAKINKFLERLALARLKKRRRHGYDSDSSDEEDEGHGESAYTYTDKNNQTGSTFEKILTASTGTSTNNVDNTTTNNNTSNPFATNNKNDNNNYSNTVGTNTETPTTTSLNVDNNNNNIQLKTTSPLTTTTTNSTTVINNNTNTQQDDEDNAENNDTDKNNNQRHLQHRATPGSISYGTPRKYSWRCIRGQQTDGKLRGTYRTEDLVIQALTGVPISNAINTHVPMHSASRAMRHTATFKMHKIVERLIHERTKYERHQVEEIKRQQQQSSAEPTESGISSTTGPGGVTGLSRRLSKSTLQSQLSTR